MRKATTLLATLTLLSSPSVSSAQGVADFINWGCETVATPAWSCFLTVNVRGPGAPGELARGSKEGKACGYNILALFSWGDLRIATAMKNGGITQISSVDSEAFQLVPAFYGFSRYCTVVSGE